VRAVVRVALDADDLSQTAAAIACGAGAKEATVTRGQTMAKRARSSPSAADAVEDAMMERVKRLAIESRTTSPPAQDSVSGEDEFGVAACYRQQARRLRELHFERLHRAAILKGLGCSQGQAHDDS
jgi:hypothetical protein